MQNTVKCPVCGSDLDFELNGVEKTIKRISFPPQISRSQFYMNIIYLLIGALLALAGVSLPSCTDLEDACSECDSDSAQQMETDSDSDSAQQMETDSDSDSAQQMDTGKDTAADNRLKPVTGSSDMDGDTDGQMEGDTETDTGIVISITDDCEAMRKFFSDCYWSEENFTGPTYTQITEECSFGNTITEMLAQWHACWKMDEENCTCPGIATDSFECQLNKCRQWITCMTTCRL